MDTNEKQNINKKRKRIQKGRGLFYRRPSVRIALRYAGMVTLLMVIFSFLLPLLLNYGPESINTDFDIQMSYVPYWFQFLCIDLFFVFLIMFSTMKLFKSVDKFYLSSDKKKYDNVELIKKVRKKCFSLPYLIPLFELLMPSISVLLILLITGSHLSIMVFKILIIVFSFSMILASLSFIFSKGIYNEILTKTYKENINIGLRMNLKFKILLQVLPAIVFCILLLTFLGYSFAVREKEEALFNVYNQSITEQFSEKEVYDYDTIYYRLDKLKTFSKEHTKFILTPEGNVITLQGNEPSYFVTEYTKQIAMNHNGKIYDSYGVDTQGKAVKLKTTDGDYYVGVVYNITANKALIYLVASSFVLFLISAVILYIFSDSLAKDISEVSENFANLCSNNFGTTLPVTTNDEIGDLIQSFNDVQKYSKKQVDLIQNNQDILMEQERLATLGQMVGGIAHNLKTPIMSISGATEGLKDLIKEYETSVGDSEVTVDDHHDIAKDMKNWVQKIDSYTEYMSDIITAVKGQAVTLSNQEVVTFTIGEVVKRVNILMRHELKNALIDLKINLNVDESLSLKGDVNSLVQVLNNLISNAIQAYDGSENEQIELSIDRMGENLLISVKDNGKGIPENIQAKLFKEMITTKGKKGTGLGLFMSYSNIRAHFNGNMYFTSKEGVGTTFNIELPL